MVAVGELIVVFNIVASYDSSSSSGASDELMSGPDAVVAKMTNMAASGSFSNDYYKYMESKKNRHSFSAGKNYYHIWECLLLECYYSTNWSSATISEISCKCYYRITSRIT